MNEILSIDHLDLVCHHYLFLVVLFTGPLSLSRSDSASSLTALLYLALDEAMPRAIISQWNRKYLLPGSPFVVR